MRERKGARKNVCGPEDEFWVVVPAASGVKKWPVAPVSRTKVGREVFIKLVGVSEIVGVTSL